MSAAFAKISIGVPCDLRVSSSDRVDRNLSYFKKLVDAPTGDWITACINHNHSFDKINSTDNGCSVG